MKLCGILLLMIMLAPFTAQAQEKNMQVEVYLKDRSIVRGTIIEETPQVSITLRTDDGNIVVYKMEEIEKYRQDYLRENGYGGGTHTVEKKTSGYRGFAEVGYSVSGWIHKLEVLTSHGFQIYPYLFTGIGIGLQPDMSGSWGIPIFADVRYELYELLKKPITPFIDLKIGGTVWQDSGFYMSPSIGCRFPLDGTIGLNVRLGYSHEYRSYWGAHKRAGGAFTLTVGVDF